MGTSFCWKVKLAGCVWDRTGSVKHTHFAAGACSSLFTTHTHKHSYIHPHTCATYPDERVGSVADHSVAPLEALLRTIVAIYGARVSSRTSVCVCVWGGGVLCMFCLSFCFIGIRISLVSKRNFWLCAFVKICTAHLYLHYLLHTRTHTHTIGPQSGVNRRLGLFKSLNVNNRL